jgi:hypothetical protein
MTRSDAAVIILVLALAAAPNGLHRQAKAAGWVALSDAIVADVAAAAPPLVTREQWRA